MNKKYVYFITYDLMLGNHKYKSISRLYDQRTKIQNDVDLDKIVKLVKKNTEYGIGCDFIITNINFLHEVVY